MKHVVPILFAALLSLVALKSPVAAHEWYPMECCSGLDCAPVEKVERISVPGDPTALPVLYVTTKHGSVVIPSTFPYRESKDNRMHACMRPGPDGVTMRLICVFAPPTN